MVFGEWLDESHYRHQVSLLVSHCKYTFLVVLLCSSLSPRNRLSSLPCELPENGKLKSIKTQMSTTTQRHQTHLTLQLFRVCYRSKLVDCSRRTQHAQGGLSIDCSRRTQHGPATKLEVVSVLFIDLCQHAPVKLRGCLLI